MQIIAEHGRMGWQRVSVYNWRALVEADISRWKRVIGTAYARRPTGVRKLRWPSPSTF
ncbi:hypothetical protein [Muricoccus aerilatus]|uniref:hypothetical protein n=1 Tax=Muricoccus aerilatus TaxID=452982 RepID=UPI0012EB8DA2|nr:hypothetical protein [Roseomonas aerilata]